MNTRAALFVLITTLIACKPMKKPADLIVKNAKVYTVDKAFSKAEAFVVNDGKFVAVGSNEDILTEYHSDQIIDAENKPVYPGFYDAHCHFYGYGLGLQHADLVGTNSFKEIMEILKEHHQDHPGEWLVGRGWDQNDWENKAFPNKEPLDKMFPNTAVILIRIDGHAVVVNSEAVERLGISVNDEFPKGEAIVEDGEFTGVFLENTADRFKDLIPDPDIKTQTKALLEAQENCFVVGLTSVMDAGLHKEVINLIDSMHQQGKLKMRIDAMLSANEENFKAFMEKGVYKTNRLHVHSVKMYADGALGSRGAKLIEPYNDDPDNTGILVNEPGHIREVAQRVYEHNYQLNIHAIGDLATRLLLEIYGDILEKDNDRRWRIEHAQIVHPDDFDKFGKYNVIPSMQSTHATSDMYWAGDRIGKERLKGAYALKDLLEENGWLPMGTDFPIENINPMHTFYAAVARKDLEGYPENGFQMENALSREETLRSMTIWAAKGSFEENEKGSIEKGKWADFVIMDRDIMEVDIDKVPGAQVLKTFSAGEMVYEKQ